MVEIFLIKVGVDTGGKSVFRASGVYFWAKLDARQRGRVR